MKFASVIALFALALAGVEATSPNGKMPYEGDLALKDFQVLLNTDITSTCHFTLGQKVGHLQSYVIHQ